MSDVIEKVARAHFVKKYGEIYTRKHWQKVLTDETLTGWRHEWFDIARTSILALADNISDEMVEAAIKTEWDDWSSRKIADRSKMKKAISAALRAVTDEGETK